MRNIGFIRTLHQRSQIGLDGAYHNEKKLFIKEDIMYIAGTSSLQDVWDDLNIPSGSTTRSQIYRDAVTY